eukprot:scaffold10861_cov180-Amphora_coffeaeformis.AAC.48
MRIKAPRKSLEGIFLILALFAVVSIISLHSLLTLLPSPRKDRIHRDASTIYESAPVETDILKHLGSLGFNTKENETASGCDIWRKDKTDLNPPLLSISEGLHGFREDLREYTKLVENFEGVGDLRLSLGDSIDICRKVDLHEKGLRGIFRHQQLSWTTSGYIEPLIPPMRHPEFCFNSSYLIDPSYLVHDFGAMCRKLKPTSRIVLVDMGASLTFHESLDAESPTMYLVRLFRKFGFHIDHVYAYEITPTPPSIVIDALPMELIPAFHWINVGVESGIGHRRNPFTHIVSEFNEDDFIMVKLDIDSPVMETQLSHQLLNETLGKLVDQFYFEKHVHLDELAEFWADTMDGSVRDAMLFFYDLRRKGVPSHFWV